MNSSFCFYGFKAIPYIGRLEIDAFKNALEAVEIKLGVLPGF